MEWYSFNVFALSCRLAVCIMHSSTNFPVINRVRVQISFVLGNTHIWQYKIDNTMHLSYFRRPQKHRAMGYDKGEPEDGSSLLS